MENMAGGQISDRAGEDGENSLPRKEDRAFHSRTNLGKREKEEESSRVFGERKNSMPV